MSSLLRRLKIFVKSSIFSLKGKLIYFVKVNSSSIPRTILLQVILSIYLFYYVYPEQVQMRCKTDVFFRQCMIIRALNSNLWILLFNSPHFNCLVDNWVKNEKPIHDGILEEYVWLILVLFRNLSTCLALLQYKIQNGITTTNLNLKIQSDGLLD